MQERRPEHHRVVHRVFWPWFASDLPLLWPELERPFEADGELGAEHRAQEDELLQRWE